MSNLIEYAKITNLYALHEYYQMAEMRTGQHFVFYPVVLLERSKFKLRPVLQDDALLCPVLISAKWVYN